MWRESNSFSSSYWVNGTTCSTADEPETDIWAGTQKTLEEMKDAAFLTVLNGKADNNGVTWTRSESGLPYFGENMAESGQLPYEVQFTDILNKDNITTVSDKSQTFLRGPSLHGGIECPQSAGNPVPRD